MQLKIALLAGDGIGPEVIDQAVKVCDAIAQKFNHDIIWLPALTGAAAIEAVGEPYPDETHKICISSDAVLFGAIGHPRFDNDPSAKVRPEQGLLKMRQMLGLFANVRPTFTFPSIIDKSPLKRERIEGTDLLFLRELTGGIYFGERGRKDNGHTAFDTCTYTRKEIERLAKKGFDPQYGARPVKRVIQTLVLNELAKKLLENEVDKEQIILLDAFDDELVFRNS